MTVICADWKGLGIATPTAMPSQRPNLYASQPIHARGIFSERMTHEHAA